MSKTNISKHPIYGNCEVYSPDDKLMFRCIEKRAMWYVTKTNAEILSHDPLRIKLNFKPNGLGYNNDSYGLEKLSNKCVVCGTDNELNRHHIVPTMYRRHMPLTYINHNFHDVVPICDDCHTSYERKADILKTELFNKYNIETKINVEYLQISKLAKTLINIKTLPIERKKLIESEIDSFSTKYNLSHKDYDELLYRLSNLKNEAIGYLRDVGKSVLEKYDNNQLFVEMWRNHFIENATPKFMPEKWTVDRSIIVR